jgi:DNA repair exonuclease SbcCD nuclease subunit
MQIIITADIHNGVPKRTDDCIWAMSTIREYAAENNIHAILVLGDLFHDRFNLDVAVLSKVYDFFDETDRDYDQKWVCFPGNHDMFLKNSWEITSLRPLNRLLDIHEDIKLIKIGDQRFWILPFVHFESAYVSILSKIEAKYEEGDILLTHIGVNGATLNECFLLKNWDIVTFENSPFDRVYTGHFHCTQQVGKNVWYPGSPIPFRFDEGVVDHGFFVYDTEKRDHEFIKTFETGEPERRPPDFLTLTTEMLDQDVEGDNIRIVLDREYSKNELNELRESMIEKGAKSVNWMKHKEKEIDLKKVQSAGIASGDIFLAWLKHDKPKDLSEDLLIKINEQIAQEANEKIVIEGIEDD